MRRVIFKAIARYASHIISYTKPNMMVSTLMTLIESITEQWWTFFRWDKQHYVNGSP